MSETKADIARDRNYMSGQLIKIGMENATLRKHLQIAMEALNHLERLWREAKLQEPYTYKLITDALAEIEKVKDE
jgi:hypothetical protein